MLKEEEVALKRRGKGRTGEEKKNKIKSEYHKKFFIGRYIERMLWKKINHNVSHKVISKALLL